MLHTLIGGHRAACRLHIPEMGWSPPRLGLGTGFGVFVTAYSFLFRVEAPHHGPWAPAIAHRCCPPLLALPLIVANQYLAPAARLPFVVVPWRLFSKIMQLHSLCMPPLIPYESHI